MEPTRLWSQMAVGTSKSAELKGPLEGPEDSLRSSMILGNDLGQGSCAPHGE